MQDRPGPTDVEHDDAALVVWTLGDRWVDGHDLDPGDARWQLLQPVAVDDRLGRHRTGDVVEHLPFELLTTQRSAAVQALQDVEIGVGQVAVVAGPATAQQDLLRRASMLGEQAAQDWDTLGCGSGQDLRAFAEPHGDTQVFPCGRVVVD